MRSILQCKFSNSGRINIKAFKQDSKVVVKMQIYSCKFKTKTTDKITLAYLFLLMRFYKL